MDGPDRLPGLVDHPGGDPGRCRGRRRPGTASRGAGDCLGGVWQPAGAFTLVMVISSTAATNYLGQVGEYMYARVPTGWQLERNGAFRNGTGIDSGIHLVAWVCNASASAVYVDGTYQRGDRSQAGTSRPAWFGGNRGVKYSGIFYTPRPLSQADLDTMRGALRAPAAYPFLP